MTGYYRTAVPAVPVTGGVHARVHAVRHAGSDIGASFFFVVVLTLAAVGFACRIAIVRGRRLKASPILKLALGIPLTWLALAIVHAETGWLESGWVGLPLWFGLVALVLAFGHHLVPARLRRLSGRLFGRAPVTHGSAASEPPPRRFGILLPPRRRIRSCWARCRGSRAAGTAASARTGIS